MKEPFKIVFSDDYIIVLEKCVKILVQPTPKKEKITLTYLLQKKISQKVFLCHRLDRETTGLIIYARSAQLQANIMDQFRRGEVKKGYYAFVKGNLDKKSGVIEGKIIDSQGKRFGEKPKPAKTFYRVEKRMPEFSLIKLEPKTGRTNQLRIHLAGIGHPILGERKYAFGRDFKVKFKRLALHAYLLHFLHPFSRDVCKLEIDLAPDMKDFLEKRSKSF